MLSRFSKEKILEELPFADLMLSSGADFSMSFEEQGNRINMLNQNSLLMQCAVYDTYVAKKDGRVMHFDVIVEDKTPHEKAIEYGKEYLASVGQAGQTMTQEECQFCHVQAAPPVVEKSIRQQGYFIQTMEGCPR